MMPLFPLVSVHAANQILPIFGITEPSELYDRRVKAGGFTLEDFSEVLCESRFVFTLDDGAELPYELRPISAVLEEPGAKFHVDVPEYGDAGFVSFGGKSRTIKYVASDNDDFEDVIIALQAIVPPSIEFRAGTGNHERDSWIFAVLLREEWSVLQTIAGNLVGAIFKPLQDTP